jgi:hypothetical protein
MLVTNHMKVAKMQHFYVNWSKIVNFWEEHFLTMVDFVRAYDITKKFITKDLIGKKKFRTKFQFLSSNFLCLKYW